MLQNHAGGDAGIFVGPDAQAWKFGPGLWMAGRDSQYPVTSPVTRNDLAAKIVQRKLARAGADQQNGMPLTASGPHHRDLQGRGRQAGVDQSMSLGDDIIIAVANARIECPDIPLFAPRPDGPVDGSIDVGEQGLHFGRINHPV